MSALDPLATNSRTRWDVREVPRAGIALGNASFLLRVVSPAPQQVSRSQCRHSQVRTAGLCGPPCAMGTGTRIEEFLFPSVTAGNLPALRRIGGFEALGAMIMQIFNRSLNAPIVFVLIGLLAGAL